MIHKITKTIVRLKIINNGNMYFSQTKKAQTPKPIPAQSTAPAGTPKPDEQKQAFKLTDKNAPVMKASQIQKQFPQFYTQLQKQAADIETQQVKNHHWRMKQLKKRITPQTIHRLNKINQILNGLTQAQRQYLKLNIVKKVENIQ